MFFFVKFLIFHISYRFFFYIIKEIKKNIVDIWGVFQYTNRANFVKRYFAITYGKNLLSDFRADRFSLKLKKEGIESYEKNLSTKEKTKKQGSRL